jgi:shikimate 5-dehydrogenase
MKPSMYFIGVSTGSSSMLKLFPHWAEVLGIEAQLIGYDLSLDAPREEYRRIVERIKSDPLALGALVTSHKINLLKASRDLFDFVDDYALLCDEISSISKREGRLEGHAKDPISSRLSWQHFVPTGHFAGGAEVLCLGAGGAATAISVAVANLPRTEDRPTRFICVDRTEDRLQALRQVHHQLETDVHFEYVCSISSFDNDMLLQQLPPGSVVINATGMGKDLPGSPLSPSAVFPQRGLVWELNYRGTLEFWHQAKAQAKARNLTLEEGWVYFLHGWTQVMAQVFDLDLTAELFGKLEEAAQAIQPKI